MKERLRKMVSMLLAAAVTVTAIPAVELTAKAASAEGNIDLARQVAAEGMVLMENNGTLPLAKGTKVAMFGRAMIDYVRGGGGSGAAWRKKSAQTAFCRCGTDAREFRKG